MNLQIREIEYDERVCAPLLAEGAAGDGTFLRRLGDEWRSGACRFDRAGEFLLGAFVDGALCGIGGVSLDPYHPAVGLGRVRHVYVLKARRGRGIGRRLVTHILARARADCAMLRLRTRRPEAACLYESLGFVATDVPGETHRFVLWHDRR